jgi:Nif-specific regulatory protein
MLFLNEIGDATQSVQKQLLDLVQDRSFRRVGALGVTKLSIGIVAATHRDLRNRITLGLFREDLFYRISVMEISLPPLRERREDLPDLAQGFLEEFSARSGRPMHPLEPGVLKLLLGHRWPGNIRELRHFMQQVAVRCRDDRISETLVEECLRNSRGSPRDSLLSPSEDLEKRRLVEALDQNGWIKVRAAAALGIDRGTLAEKMRRYGINRQKDP